MCNLAEGIEERTRKEEREKAKKEVEKATKSTINSVIINMYNQGCTLDLIANVTGTNVDKVKTVIKKKNPAMA